MTANTPKDPEAVGLLIALAREVSAAFADAKHPYSIEGRLRRQADQALSALPAPGGEAVVAWRYRFVTTTDGKEWSDWYYVDSRQDVPSNPRQVAQPLYTKPNPPEGEAGHCFECETELVGPLCPECNPEIKAALSWQAPQPDASPVGTEAESRSAPSKSAPQPTTGDE